MSGTSLADRFFEELTPLVAKVAERPTSFHQITGGLRRANLASFPYHILFRENAGSVRILVLRHHRQHPTAGTLRN